MRDESLPLTMEMRLDAACRRFEAACKAGQAPRIEEQLGAATGAERLALLKELVRLDAVYRRAAGQAVSPAEYLRRFPELDAVWLEREMTPATLTNAQAPGLGETQSLVQPAPVAPASTPAIQVPGYEVALGELGRGGMGVVYLARNVAFDRREVLKVVSQMGTPAYMAPEQARIRRAPTSGRTFTAWGVRCTSC